LTVASGRDIKQAALKGMVGQDSGFTADLFETLEHPGMKFRALSPGDFRLQQRPRVAVSNYVSAGFNQSQPVEISDRFHQITFRQSGDLQERSPVAGVAKNRLHFRDMSGPLRQLENGV
jgi:hypothetical protein